MWRAAVLCTLIATVSLAAPVPKAIKANRRSFDGKWELVRQNNNDREVGKISPWIWEIRGEELYLHWGNGDGTFRRSQKASAFVRPPDAADNEMDYVYDPQQGGKPSPGRAAIEGDEFVVCWSGGGQPRPAKLKPGPGVNYYRFRRVPEK